MVESTEQCCLINCFERAIQVDEDLSRRATVYVVRLDYFAKSEYLVDATSTWMKSGVLFADVIVANWWQTPQHYRS